MKKSDKLMAGFLAFFVGGMFAVFGSMFVLTERFVATLATTDLAISIAAGLSGLLSIMLSMLVLRQWVMVEIQEHAQSIKEEEK